MSPSCLHNSGLGRPRARLGLAGRHALVRSIAAGSSIRRAAWAFNVSPATAHKWWHRWPSEGPDGLRDRSSRPRRSPAMLGASDQERICEVRRHTGWGPRPIAGVVGRPHSTVHRTLQRHGISRPPRPRREAVARYEWPCPGDLLHLDVKSYARFRRPGHAVTGDRRTKGARLTKPKLGYDFAHAAVDDHSRLAYCELRPDERAASITAFVERALGFYASHGIPVRRILTDNHWSYTRNRSLRELLERRGIEHWTIRPYRARTNGKVERFHQTMAREWGYGLRYRSSQHRARALPHWLRYYNRQRPHSSIGDRPPISRVHDVSGRDS
jgi:transposase InsO family protein